MIDPVEAVIAYLHTTPVNTLVDGRICAGRVRYGSGWTLGDPALTVQPAGGSPERYISLRAIRLAMRCWAASEHDAYGVYLGLAASAARTGREVVTLADGTVALIHELEEASGVSVIWDEEVLAWSAVVFYSATISEDAA